MRDKNIVIVGGGIAGILAALMFARKSSNLYLVEKADKLGGLLSSIKTDIGAEFDYGTHFLRETGVPKLDSILFGHLNSNEWIDVGNLRAGVYFLSHMNEDSPFPDTSLLPEEIYNKGIVQLLCADSRNREPSNLEEYLYDTFGETFTEKVFAPIARKFLFHDLKDLAPGVIGLIVLFSRLIGLTPEASRIIKSIPHFDRKLAFHSSREGISKLKNLYPVSRGIGLWIEKLEEQLIESGVKIIKNDHVVKIIHDDEKLSSLTLNSGLELKCDQLIWAVPVYQYLNCIDKKPDFKTRPPERLTTSLYHFVFDKPFLTRMHYFVCTDPDMPVFRVTLYPNVQVTDTHKYRNRLTVEVLSIEKPDTSEISKQVLNNLIEMKVVSNDAQVLYQSSEVLNETFPVPTSGFVEDSARQLKFARSIVDNCMFIGRGVGRNWFLQDILADTFQQINTHIDKANEARGTVMTFQQFDDAKPGSFDKLASYFTSPMPEPPQEVLESFEHLEADPYLKTDWTFRRRGFSHGTVSREGLIWLHGSDFFQSKSVNGYMGGVIRHFAPLGPVIKNHFEKILTSGFYNNLYGDGTYNFGLHQIRVLSDSGREGMPVPEGIHQDGFDFVAIHCMNRYNIEGGVSLILEGKDGPTVFESLLPPNSVVICNDRNLWHSATAIHAKDKDKGIGFRDVCVVTFDKIEE